MTVTAQTYAAGVLPPNQPRRREDYRPEIEMPPPRIAALPVFRGYPVPFFVGWLDNGEPEFRGADGRKLVRAVRENLCWVCGDRLGTRMTFVAGPMCGINRTSAEPPCHLECARYAAINCPFLSKPQMTRRENDLPAESRDAAGHMIRRNPGVTLLWTCRGYEVFDDGRGGTLFRFPAKPESYEWYFRGRPATRAEVEESVRSGLPNLQAICRGQDDLDDLSRLAAAFTRYYPAENSLPAAEILKLKDLAESSATEFYPPA
jgi:hypothetical protein